MKRGFDRSPTRRKARRAAGKISYWARMIRDLSIRRELTRFRVIVKREGVGFVGLRRAGKTSPK
jgi:hypothetical protein